MKRIGNLRDQIVSEANCRAAINKASEKKRWRTDVQRVLHNIDSYAYELSCMLSSLSYEPSPYTKKTITDTPSKKSRDILVPRFWPDQCIHHAIMMVLAPILKKRMYYWSCGSIEGRGTKHAIRGIERATFYDKKHAKYAAKLDVVHCYQEMKPDMTIKRLRRVIKDQWLLQLLQIIVNSCDCLPIGNYTSPWFCNLSLTELDFLIKQKMGVEHYIRYADDMTLMSSNKRRLHRAVTAISDYLDKEIHVRLHSNWQVFKVRRDGDGNRNRPIDFVGKTFCIGYTCMRKRNSLSLMRQSRAIQSRQKVGMPISFHAAAGFISRSAQCLNCNAYGLKHKFVDVIPQISLKEVVRNESRRLSRAGGSVFHGGFAVTQRV